MFQRKTITKRQLLFPKQNGLKEKDKPFLLIVRMAHDEGRNDNAVAYSPTKKLAEERGYTVVNTKEIVFDESNGKLMQRDRKGHLVETDENTILTDFFCKQGKPLVIWLEAHGAPSWLFGAEKSFESEARGTKLFRDCLQRIQAKNNIDIDDILISACYSGTELFNPETGAYTNSPARLLSILVPEKNVVGVIGVTSSAKVRGFVDSSNQKKIIGLEEACILFRNGKAYEYNNKQDLLCNPEFVHMQPFVMESCGIPEKSEKVYPIYAAREHVQLLRSKTKKRSICFADRQLSAYEKETKSQNAPPAIQNTNNHEP